MLFSSTDLEALNTVLGTVGAGVKVSVTSTAALIKSKLTNAGGVDDITFEISEDINVADINTIEDKTSQGTITLISGVYRFSEILRRLDKLLLTYATALTNLATPPNVAVTAFNLILMKSRS